MRDAAAEWAELFTYIGELAVQAGGMAASVREQLFSEEDMLNVHEAALDEIQSRVMAEDADGPIHSAELLAIAHQWCADHIRRAIENPRGRV